MILKLATPKEEGEKILTPYGYTAFGAQTTHCEKWRGICYAFIIAKGQTAGLLAFLYRRGTRTIDRLPNGYLRGGTSKIHCGRCGIRLN